MKYVFYLFIAILLFSCAPKKASIDLANIENELNKKLILGKNLFDKKKYSRAKENFDHIILNDRGSEIGV